MRIKVVLVSTQTALKHNFTPLNKAKHLNDKQRTLQICQSIVTKSATYHL